MNATEILTNKIESLGFEVKQPIRIYFEDTPEGQYFLFQPMVRRKGSEDIFRIVSLPKMILRKNILNTLTGDECNQRLEAGLNRFANEIEFVETLIVKNWEIYNN